MGFNCKIYHDENNILHDEYYKCLKDIADELGLTYQQVADLSSRKETQKYRQFKFFPKIEITRVKKESQV